MPQFTFEAPDGQRHTIEGPEGASKEDAFKILQQHLGSGQQDSKQSSPADSYHSRLNDALNTAMKALAPSWNHNDSSYSPYKPAQPGNMPNDAVNPVGTDAQMATALGAAGAARLGAGALAGAPKAPPISPVNMAKMPTQQSFGAQMAGNVGQAPSAGIGGAAAATPQAAGNALQTQLLQAGLKYGAPAIGHAVGGPVGGAAAHFIPKILGLMK